MIHKFFFFFFFLLFSHFLFGQNNYSDTSETTPIYLKDVIFSKNNTFYPVRLTLRRTVIFPCTWDILFNYDSSDYGVFAYSGPDLKNPVHHRGTKLLEGKDTIQSFFSNTSDDIFVDKEMNPDATDRTTITCKLKYDLFFSFLFNSLNLPKITSPVDKETIRVLYANKPEKYDEGTEYILLQAKLGKEGGKLWKSVIDVSNMQDIKITQTDSTIVSALYVKRLNKSIDYFISNKVDYECNNNINRNDYFLFEKADKSSYFSTINCMFPYCSDCRTNIVKIVWFFNVKF